MTITKLAIQEEQMAIVLGFAEVLPSDTKIFINDIQVPIQAIYTAETGFSPQPGDRDQFSMAFSWHLVENWALGDAFSIVNSEETRVVSGYGSGFEQ
jgi:hypothetical protein